jgi:hypothetical protein
MKFGTRAKKNLSIVRCVLLSLLFQVSLTEIEIMSVNGLDTQSGAI